MYHYETTHWKKPLEDNQVVLLFASRMNVGNSLPSGVVSGSLHKESSGELDQLQMYWKQRSLFFGTTSTADQALKTKMLEPWCLKLNSQIHILPP